jgi:hypothetical protein
MNQLHPALTPSDAVFLACGIVRRLPAQLSLAA